MVVTKHAPNNLDFDELSVTSYDQDNNNNNQLSSLNIDRRESLLSSSEQYELDYNNNNGGNGNDSSSNQKTHDNNNKTKKTNLPLLSACYMTALTTGATTYAFSFYSNALKSSLHLSQNQLDTLSSAIFCAGVLSWIPGMIVDSFGPRMAMITGGLGNTIHLTCYWMIVTERWKLQNLNVLIVLLCILGVLIFMGCALVTGSVFKVIVESCGKGTKGKAVGCAKGYVGVGSGVYVCLFGAIFGGSSSHGGAKLSTSPLLVSSLSSSLDGPQNPELNSLNFLIMAAILSFLAAVLPPLCLLPKQTSRGVSSYKNIRDGTRNVHFRVIYAGLTLLGFWVVGISLTEIDNTGNGGDNGGVSPEDPSIVNKTSIYWDRVDPRIDFSSPYESASSSLSFEANIMWNFVRRKLSSQSSSPERHWDAAFLLIFLWLGPSLSLLVIPPRQEGTVEGTTPERNAHDFSYDDHDDGNQINNENDDEGEDEEEMFFQDDAQSGRSLRFRKRNSEREDRITSFAEQNYTMLQMLRTSSAWLMAFTCVVLVGGGTVMTNNIGQMTEALGFDSNLTPASLALFSAAQAASRVVTGAVSEAALSWKLPWFCGSLSSGARKGLSRPAFLVVASIVSTAAHFSLAVAKSEEGFALGVTLSGIAFGMVWPLMVLITGEVFGTLHVGANYMFFDGFSSAFGTLLLSKFVAQTVYDDHINEDHVGPGGSPDGQGNFKCFGADCFRLSHLIVSVLSLTCILSSVGLIWTTKDTYRRS